MTDTTFSELLFDRMPMGVAVFDCEMRLRRCNPTWASFVEQYTPAAADQIVHGVRLFDLVPEIEPGLAPALVPLLAGETLRAEAARLEIGGIVSYWDVVLAPLIEHGEVTGVLLITIDATERVLAYQLLEQRVAERTRELETLLEVSHNVASTLELRPLLALILDNLKTVVDYTGASLFTLEGDTLTILEYCGPIPVEKTWGVRFALGEAAANRAVIEGRAPVIIPDVCADTPLAHAFQQVAGEEIATTYNYIRSWMGIPLLTKERIIGMLSLDHERPNEYTEHDAGLALAIANQAAIAIENARLYQQAQTLATLQERQRLARELHDSVSQALYSIALSAHTARTLLTRDPSRAAEPLDYVLSLANAGMAEMRALIFELRPESLREEGLTAALNKQAAAIRVRHQLEVSLDLGDDSPLPLDIEETLYRVAQEALHNVVRHARATQVQLQLTRDPQGITLSIRDNGQGFDPYQPFPGHLGLRSMHERIARHGGTFTIQSAPTEGTRITASLPLTPKAESTPPRSS
jgi:signal transduction histidine kinase